LENLQFEQHIVRNGELASIANQATLCKKPDFTLFKPQMKSGTSHIRQAFTWSD